MGPNEGLAGWLRGLINRLAMLWSSPRIGRVALCSPVVGLIAGLGAVVFLVSLQFTYKGVLGGLLHFYRPSMVEEGPHSITYPYPWWLILLVRRWAG
jgi:CIC family chloride channel protein